MDAQQYLATARWAWQVQAADGVCAHSFLFVCRVGRGAGGSILLPGHHQEWGSQDRVGPRAGGVLGQPDADLGRPPEALACEQGWGRALGGEDDSAEGLLAQAPTQLSSSSPSPTPCPTPLGNPCLPDGALGAPLGPSPFTHS